MAQYIDKAAVVAWIEKRIEKIDKYYCDVNCAYQRIEECQGFLNFLDTIEVREVDLDKEYQEYVEEDPVYNKLVNGIVGKSLAKHFFELGIKAQKG